MKVSNFKGWVQHIGNVLAALFVWHLYSRFLSDQQIFEEVQNLSISTSLLLYFINGPDVHWGIEYNNYAIFSRNASLIVIYYLWIPVLYQRTQTLLSVLFQLPCLVQMHLQQAAMNKISQVWDGRKGVRGKGGWSGCSFVQLIFRANFESPESPGIWSSNPKIATGTLYSAS